MRRSKKTLAERQTVTMRALQLAQVHIHRAARQLSTISRPGFHPHLKVAARIADSAQSNLRTAIAQVKVDVESLALQHRDLYEETLKLERASIKLREPMQWAPNPQRMEYWQAGRKCDSILGCGRPFNEHDEMWGLQTDMRATNVCAVCVRLLGLTW